MVGKPSELIYVSTSLGMLEGQLETHVFEILSHGVNLRSRGELIPVLSRRRLLHI